MVLCVVISHCFVFVFVVFSFSCSPEEFASAVVPLLASLQEKLENPIFDDRNLEVSLSDGVLTVESPLVGTWVLNRHNASRQLWLSSPLSGPSKFSLDTKDQTWRNERNSNLKLSDLLEREFSKSFNSEFKLSDKF